VNGEWIRERMDKIGKFSGGLLVVGCGSTSDASGCQVRPSLDAFQISNFYTLSITSNL
jgi:hypothetical protein